MRCGRLTTINWLGKAQEGVPAGGRSLDRISTPFTASTRCFALIALLLTALGLAQTPPAPGTPDPNTVPDSAKADAFIAEGALQLAKAGVAKNAEELTEFLLQAAASFRQAVALNRNSRTARTRLAVTLQRLAQNSSDPRSQARWLDEATASFNRLLIWNTQDENARVGLATNALIILDARIREARRRLGRTESDVSPLPDEIKQQIADSSGEFVEQGIAYAKEALEIHPPSAPAMRLLSALLRGRANLQKDAVAAGTDLAAADLFTRRAEEEEKKSNANAGTHGVTGRDVPPPGFGSGRGNSLPSLYRLGGAVSAPEVIHQVEPAFPSKVDQAINSATVQLSALVGVDGVPQNIVVLQSPDPAFAEEAVSALQQWRFRPAMKTGRPVPVNTTLEVRFRRTPPTPR